MSALAEAINLYISTVSKYKDQAEKSVVSRAAVANGNIYVDGQPYDFESVSPNRIIDGDVVYVARTDDDGKVVVLG